MKVFLIQLLLCLSLLPIIGCGSKSSPVSLEVSSSFSLGASGFTGGLIAYGEGPNAEKFSVSVDTGKSLTANLLNGAWQIYVVGWDGVQKFTGTKYCGIASINLGASDSAVNITASTTNCSDPAFQASIDLQNLMATSCGAFYKYNLGTDAYTNPGGTEDTYCASLPTSLSYSHEYYKISALHIGPQGSSLGITTGCIQNTPGTPTRLELPTKKIPLAVRTYPNLSECQKISNPQVAQFDFPNGLQSGDPASFDHEYAQTGGNARLSLPSFMTRRGRSPFMSMIPRILCGASPSLTDCLLDPINSKTVNVSFYNYDFHDKQILLKGFGNTSTVPAGLFSNLTHFNVENLQIKEGSLYGDVSKNMLSCQGLYDFTEVVDIYKKNDLIYMLFNDTFNNSWVKVYSTKGKELNRYEFSGNLFYKLVASTDKTLYLLNPTSVKQYIFSGTYPPTPSASRTGIDFQEMELNANGSFLALAVGSASSIQVLSTSDLGGTPLSTHSYSSPMKSMQLVGSTLHYLASNGIKTASFATSTLPPATPVANPTAALSIYFSGTNYFVSQSANNKIDKYDISGNTLILSSAPLLAGPNKQMIGFDGKVYLIDGTSSELHIFSDSVLSPVHQTTGECTESSTVTGPPTGTITFNTKSDDSVYRLFEQGFETAGLRFVTDPNAFYYFRSLGSDGNEIRTGGHLSHAQDMLGPDGVASFVSEFTSCSALLAAIPPGGALTRTRSLFDIFENKTSSHTVSVKAVNTLVNTYFCNDINPTGTCTSDAYNLQIDYHSNNPGEIDRGRIKLTCGRKLGTLESFEIRGGAPNRDLSMWNTTSVNASRFESYELEDKSEKRASIQKFEKTSSQDFWSRSIQTHESSNGFIQSSVTEFHLASSQLMFESLHLSDTSLTNFLANTTNYGDFEFQGIKDNTTFSAPINGGFYALPRCLNASVNNTQAAIGTCTLGTFPAIGSSVMSASPILLEIGSMVGITDTNHALRGVGVFTLTAP